MSFFSIKDIYIEEHVCVCAQARTAEAVASEPSLPEFLLMGWAFTRVPTLFMNFSSAFLVFFAFGFTTYFGLLPLSLSQFIVSQEKLTD